jgi:hypothetical protein
MFKKDIMALLFTREIAIDAVEALNVPQPTARPAQAAPVRRDQGRRRGSINPEEISLR